MPTTSGEIYDGVSAFLGKLLNMIEDERTNHLITWSKDGNSFIIPDQLEFAKVLLPKYYKHNNMASFIRQLNMYGFHKVISTACCTGDRVEFLHPYFVRGRPHLLKNIKRKMTGSTREFESNSVWKLGNLEKLINEVRDIKMKQQNVDVQLNTIKQENEILWREVSILRHKHKEQQELVNRVIRFLLSLAHASNDGYEKRKFVPLMIKDSRFNSSDREPHSDHQYGKYSTSPGPIIHELHPDILDDRRVIEVSSTPTIEIDSEMISSPSSTLSSSPKMIDSGEAAVKVGLNNNDMAEEETTTIYLPVKIPTKSATSSSSSKQEMIQAQTSSEPYVLSSDAAGADVLLDLVENPDPNTEYITICLSPSEIHGNSPEPQVTSVDFNEVRPKRRKTIASPVTSTTKKVSSGGRGIRLSRTKSGICVDRVKPRSTPVASRAKKIARSNQITADTPIIIDNSDIEHLENDDTEYFIDISDLQQAISAQKASKPNNDEAVNVSYKKPIRVVSTWPIERPQPKGASSSAVQTSSGSRTKTSAGLERLRKQVEKERKEPTAIPAADISDPVNQLNKLLASPASNEIGSTSRSNLFDKQTATGATFSKEENEALLNLVVDGDNSSLLNYFKDSAAKSPAVVSEIDSILSNSSITTTAKSAPSPVNTSNNRLVIANSDSLNQLLESSSKFPAASPGVLQSSSSKTQDLSSQLGASVPATNEIYNLTGISSDDNSNIFADVEKSVSAYQQQQNSLQNTSGATTSHVRSSEPTLVTSASSDMSVALNDYSINNYPDRYNKLDLKEISNNLSSVQADLDNLKDLIKREGIQVDYNSILGLNSDDSNEYNNFSSDLLSPSSSMNKSKVEGNELVSCNSPFNNVDLMDFNDWINWSLPVTPQSADQLSTITDTGEPMLNTPQPISYYTSSPGGEKRSKKS